MADMELDQGVDVLQERARYAEYAIFGVIILAGLMFLGEMGELAGLIDINAVVPDALTTAYIFVGLGFFVAYLISVVVICFWLYRAHANLRAAGHEDLQFTPGWAVGWYFVPILNLFMPFRAMKELWATTFAEENQFSSEAPGTIALWWGALIVSGIVSNVGARFQAGAGPGSTGYSTGLILASIGTILMIVSAYYLRTLIRQISAGQKAGLNVAEVFS